MACRFWAWLKSVPELKPNLIYFASTKLNDGQAIRGGITERGSLAALSTRLLLEFEPKREKAAMMENELVAGNMRIVYSIPNHQEYIRSGYPSEPILAEAAAQIMEALEKMDAGRSRSTPLKELKKFVDRNLISIGERGELVARLLLTLAHDKAINKFKSLRRGDNIKFSQPISLLEYLDCLVPRQWMKSVRECRAVNLFSSLNLEEAFRGAKIHFTHFVKAESPLMLSDEAA